MPTQMNFKVDFSRAVICFEDHDSPALRVNVLFLAKQPLPVLCPCVSHLTCRSQRLRMLRTDFVLIPGSLGRRQEAGDVGELASAKR